MRDFVNDAGQVVSMHVQNVEAGDRGHPQYYVQHIIHVKEVLIEWTRSQESRDKTFLQLVIVFKILKPLFFILVATGVYRGLLCI